MYSGFQYQAKETYFHKIHPLAKLSFLIIFLFCALSEVRWYDPFLLLLFLISISIFTNIKIISFLLHSRLLLITGLFIITLQVITRPNGTILFYLIPSFVPYIGNSIPVTDFGLFKGLNLFGRFAAILSSSFLFVQTTNPEKFAVSFQQLKIPYRYSYALIIALRFVPLFDIEASQIMKSMAVRGIEFDTKMPFTRTYKIIKYTFVPLIISTLQRSDNLAISMQLRGFGAFKTRTAFKPITYKWYDLFVFLLGFLLLFTVYLL